jgi:hypothetical protein
VPHLRECEMKQLRHVRFSFLAMLRVSGFGFGEAGRSLRREVLARHRQLEVQ